MCSKPKLEILRSGSMFGNDHSILLTASRCW